MAVGLTPRHFPMQRKVSPGESLMDVLHEVRQMSRQLQQSARAAVACCGSKTYQETLHSQLESRMRAGDARTRIVCYASAAELGVAVDLLTEQCEPAMTGEAGLVLRVLFWSTYRRMQSARTQRERHTAPAAGLADPPSMFAFAHGGGRGETFQYPKHA